MALSFWIVTVWLLLFLSIIESACGSILEETLLFGNAAAQEGRRCCWLLRDGALTVTPHREEHAAQAELRIYGTLSRLVSNKQKPLAPEEVEFIFYPSTQREYVGYHAPNGGSTVQYCCPLEADAELDASTPPGCNAATGGHVLVTTAVATPLTLPQRKMRTDWHRGALLRARARHGAPAGPSEAQTNRKQHRENVPQGKQSIDRGRPCICGAQQRMEWLRDEASDPMQQRVLHDAMQLNAQEQGQEHEELMKPRMPLDLSAVVGQRAVERIAGVWHRLRYRSAAQETLECVERGLATVRVSRDAALAVAVPISMERGSSGVALHTAGAKPTVPAAAPGRQQQQTERQAHHDQRNGVQFEYLRHTETRDVQAHEQAPFRVIPVLQQRKQLNQTTATPVYRYRLTLPLSTSRMDFGVLIFPVRESGIHELLVASCTGTNISMHLVAEWQSAHGYLAAELYPLLPFYGWMTVLYVAAGAVWILACYVQLGRLSTAQHVTTFLLFLGLFESFLHFQAYHWANQSGKRICCPPGGLVMIGDFVATVRSTLTRVLVLAASMGLLLLSPRLMPAKAMLLKWFALVYTLSAGSLEMLETLSQGRRSGLMVVVPVSVLVSILETLFYFWMLFALRQTWIALQRRDLSEKRGRFRIFIVMLVAYACSVLAYVGFAFAFLWKGANGRGGITDANWHLFWLVGPYPGLGTGALGDTASVMILAAIMWIWFPTSTRHEELLGTGGTPTAPNQLMTLPAKSSALRRASGERLESRFELDEEND
jgi:hypothetical protein